MKTKKIIKIIENQFGCNMYDEYTYEEIIELIRTFKLGMKHGKREYQKELRDKYVELPDVWISEFKPTQLDEIRKSQDSEVKYPCTNKSGGHKDNPEWCKRMEKCTIISNSNYYSCEHQHITCKHDTR